MRYFFIKILCSYDASYLILITTKRRGYDMHQSKKAFVEILFPAKWCDKIITCIINIIRNLIPVELVGKYMFKKKRSSHPSPGVVCMLLYIYIVIYVNRYSHPSPGVAFVLLYIYMLLFMLTGIATFLLVLLMCCCYIYICCYLC